MSMRVEANAISQNQARDHDPAHQDKLLPGVNLDVYLAAAGAANAPAPIPYVTRRTQGAKQKRAVFKIQENELHKISTEKFTKQLLEGVLCIGSCPTYGGTPVIKDAAWLGVQGDTHILYTQTGGNFFVSSRSYIVGLTKNPDSNERKTKISWKLLDNYNSKTEQFTGEWGKKVASMGYKPFPDSVWTPFNEGSWELDLNNRTITYSVDVDTGGSLPFSPDAATLVYPNYLANQIFGLGGGFEIR